VQLLKPEAFQNSHFPHIKALHSTIYPFSQSMETDITIKFINEKSVLPLFGYFCCIIFFCCMNFEFNEKFRLKKQQKKAALEDKKN
jgi:hypothetical protein